MTSKKKLPKRAVRKEPLPAEQLWVGRPYLCRRYGLSRFQLLKWIDAGAFPAGIRLATAAHARWRLADVEAWEASRFAAKAG